MRLRRNGKAKRKIQSKRKIGMKYGECSLETIGSEAQLNQSDVLGALHKPLT